MWSSKRTTQLVIAGSAVCFTVAVGSQLLIRAHNGPYYRGRSITAYWGACGLNNNDATARASAATILAEALGDEDDDVRATAAGELMMHGEEHKAEVSIALPALRRALQDKDERARRYARGALIALGDIKGDE
jgi:hypothetical protein